MHIGLIFLIILINVVYVSMSTIRMILVIKGRKWTATFLSMFEVFIYVMGLSIVLKHLNDPANIVAYSIGYGLGVFLGSKIEEYIALGYIIIQVTVDSEGLNLPEKIRERGYGVTTWTASGRDGDRLVMQVLAKRSNEKKLMQTISELSPKAFVISYEPRNFRGGFWIKRLKK